MTHDTLPPCVSDHDTGSHTRNTQYFDKGRLRLPIVHTQHTTQQVLEVENVF